MKHKMAWWSAALLLLAPMVSGAQAPGVAEAQFAYCTVIDNGDRRAWVSDIFVSPVNTGHGHRLLSSEFHDYIASLGGAGDKNCVLRGSRAELESIRQRTTTPGSSALPGTTPFTVTQVTWKPGPAAYAFPPALPEVPRDHILYCWLEDEKGWQFSSFFLRRMPAQGEVRFHEELHSLGKQFKKRAERGAAWTATSASCITHDTRAEAEKHREDKRRKYQEFGSSDVAWSPEKPMAVPVSSAAPAMAKPGVPSTPRPVGPIVVPPMPAKPLSAPAMATAAANFGSPFFRLPSGSGAAMKQSGTLADPKVGNVDFQKSILRLPDSSSCSLRQITQGKVANMEAWTKTEATGWAGLIPSKEKSTFTGATGDWEASSRLREVSNLQGKPFPLIYGNRFGFDLIHDIESTFGKMVTTAKWNCTVGPSVAASTTIPGEPGLQTQVDCRSESQSEFMGQKTPPTKADARFFWYENNGCFLPYVPE